MTANPSEEHQSAPNETTDPTPASTTPSDTPTQATPEEGTPAAASDDRGEAAPATDAPADQPSADQPAPEPDQAAQPQPEPEASGTTEPGAAVEATAARGAAEEPAAEEPAAEGSAALAESPSGDDASTPGDGAPGSGRKKKRKKGKGGGGDAVDGTSAAGDEGKPQDKPQEKKKPAGPDPVAITRQIGKTSEAALAYVQNPDPKLSRMARKHREAVITEIPPVTAGALLGPEALCRHFLASAASGRYRDLFFLWDLFVLFPDDCKPVLASRQKAQEKARAKLRTATHLGLLGDAGRVAEDIDRATGLPWRWLRETLEPMGPAIRQRPVVLAAVLRRIPDFDVAVPEDPSDRWLAEAAALKESGADIPAAVDDLLGAHADRLPATVATLSMAQSQYPDRVPALIDRVDLSARDIGAIMAWARDHGHADQLIARISGEVESAAAIDRATGLATWKRWQERGVDVAMPASLASPTLEGLDLGKPESAELIKVLVDGGADLDPQKILDDIAADNRTRGENAYEAFVCAGFDQVHLPLVLEGNPVVRPETRCPACQAWTWVRPGHENRCPRLAWSAQDGVMSPQDADQDAAAAVDAAVAGLDAPGPSADPAPPPEAPATDAWSQAAAADAPADQGLPTPAPPPRPSPPPTAPMAREVAPGPQADPTPDDQPAGEDQTTDPAQS